MRLLKSLFIAAIAVGLTAAAASATVSVTHVASASDIEVGDTVSVDVIAGFDGVGDALIGIFTSAQWDPSVLEFQTASAAPFILFPGAGGILSKAADPGSVFPGDAAGSVRTIQFGAGPGQSGGPGPDTTVTTLTFLAIGAGDGTVAVSFNNGDEINGGGTAVLTDAAITVIPEPGTALLMGLGLAGLGAAGRRNR